MAIYCTGCGAMMQLQSYSQAKCPSCGKTTTINGMTAQNWDSYVPKNIENDPNCRFCILCGGQIFWSPDKRTGTCTKCKSTMTTSPASTPSYRAPVGGASSADIIRQKKEKEIELSGLCEKAFCEGDMAAIKMAIQTYFQEVEAVYALHTNCYRAALAINGFEYAPQATWFDLDQAFDEKGFEEALALYKKGDYAQKGEKVAQAWLAELKAFRKRLAYAWAGVSLSDLTAFCQNSTYQEAKETRKEVELAIAALDRAQEAEAKRLEMQQKQAEKQQQQALTEVEGKLKALEALPPVKGLFKKKKQRQRDAEIAALKEEVDQRRKKLRETPSKTLKQNMANRMEYSNKRSALRSPLYDLEKPDNSVCPHCTRKTPFCPYLLLKDRAKYDEDFGILAELPEEEKQAVETLREMLHDFCSVIYSLNNAMAELEGKINALYVRKPSSLERNFFGFTPCGNPSLNYRLPLTGEARRQESAYKSELAPLQEQWNSLMWRLTPLSAKE